MGSTKNFVSVVLAPGHLGTQEGGLHIHLHLKRPSEGVSRVDQETLVLIHFSNARCRLLLNLEKSVCFFCSQFCSFKNVK